jgi:hypothetical protein
VIRDICGAVQRVLDSAAGRARPGSVSARLLGVAATQWTTVWLIAVTAIAAAVAWLAALLLNLSTPVPAAVAAVLTVALSINRSLRTGLSLILATAAALTLAFVLYRVWGIHIWTVAVLVAASLIIGRVVRLGREGALQIPATALFVYVLGDQLTNQVILQRMLATLLGVCIGVAFSFVAHPERPEQRVTEQLADASRRLGLLLEQIGERTSRGVTRREAAEWLTHSRELAVEVEAIGDALDDLHLGGRFALGSERSRGRALRRQYAVVFHTAQHVHDIAHGIFDATAGGAVVKAEALGAMLSRTGAALEVHARTLPKSIDQVEPPTGLLRALDAVEEERARSVARLKSMDDTSALLLGGAIVSEVDRMVDRLASPGQEEPQV